MPMKRNDRGGASLRRRSLAALVLAAGLTPPREGLAQAYPTKPIKLIVPFPPGGGTDVVARIMAEQLTTSLGQTMFVENKAGANGNLAAAYVVKSEADGYTLLFTNTSIMTIAPSIYSNLTFDPARDLMPVVRVAEVPNLLVVNPSLPVHSVADLVALAKAQPGKLALASGGSGSVSHLTGETFKLAAGVQMLHVPYKGNAPQIADIVAGQVPAGIADLSGALPQIRAAKLRALAITTKTRSRFLPDVPSLLESGLLTFESSVWVGMVAPADTPSTVVSRLEQAANAVLAQPEIAKRIDELGFVVVGGTPAEFATRIKDEGKHWKDVVVASGAVIE